MLLWLLWLVLVVTLQELIVDAIVYLTTRSSMLRFSWSLLMLFCAWLMAICVHCLFAGVLVHLYVILGLLVFWLRLFCEAY